MTYYKFLEPLRAKFCGNYDITKTYLLGDMCVGENNKVYIYTANSEWTEVADTEDDEKSSYILPKICSRCGAPLKNHICEYCGTKY